MKNHTKVAKTEIGSDFEIVIINGKHCSVSNFRKTEFSISNVNYVGSAHLFLHSDGKFHVGKEGEDKMNSIFLTRADKDPKKKPSTSAKERFISEAERVVNEFYDEEKSKEDMENLFFITDRVYMLEAIEQRKERVVKAENAIKTWNKEIEALRKGELLPMKPDEDIVESKR